VGGLVAVGGARRCSFWSVDPLSRTHVDQSTYRRHFRYPSTKVSLLLPLAGDLSEICVCACVLPAGCAYVTSESEPSPLRDHVVLSHYIGKSVIYVSEKL
jgi:hypothetical protein